MAKCVKNYLGKTSPKHCHEIQPWNRLSKNHTIASYQHRVNTNSIPVVQKEEAFYDASIVIPAPSVNVDPYLFNNNKICDYPRLCRGTQDIMERSLFFNSSF